MRKQIQTAGTRFGGSRRGCAAGALQGHGRAASRGFWIGSQAVCRHGRDASWRCLLACIALLRHGEVVSCRCWLACEALLMHLRR